MVQDATHSAALDATLSGVMRRLLLMLCFVVLAALGGRAVLEPPPRDGEVTRVVDGDTIHVRVAGTDETVRLLGIDTPERGECGFAAASQALTRLADGHRVALVTDPTQDRRDRYGRLLAYVVTRGGLDLGEAVLRRGWARVYVFDRPFARLVRYRTAAAAARRTCAN